MNMKWSYDFQQRELHVTADVQVVPQRAIDNDSPAKIIELLSQIREDLMNKGSFTEDLGSGRTRQAYIIDIERSEYSFKHIKSNSKGITIFVAWVCYDEDQWNLCKMTRY